MMKLVLIILVSAFFISCKNPLGGSSSGSDISKNFHPGTAAAPVLPEITDVTMNVSFTNGTESNFLFNGLDFSSSMNLEIANNTVRIKPTVHADNSVAGFGTPSSTNNLQWDNTSKVYRLNASINDAILESSWTPQWSSLVAYWRMENNWQDSINSLNGTAFNGPTLTSANKQIENYSGNFNPSGNDDYVQIADPGAGSVVDFSQGDEITISAWIYYTGNSSDSSYRYIIGKGRNAAASTNQNWSLRVYAASANLVRPSFLYRNSTDTVWHTWVSSYGVPIQRWQHWVFTYKFGVGNSAAVYVNGELIPGTWSTGNGNDAPLVNNANIWIGNSLGPATASCFVGNLDDIAVWRKMLTVDEIKSIYDRQSARFSGVFTSRIMDAGSNQDWNSLAPQTPHPFLKELPPPGDSEVSSVYGKVPTVSTASPGLSEGLVGYWKFNEPSGSTTFTSSVGTGLDLTAYNSPRSGIKARFGNGVRFSRSDSNYMTTPGSVALGSTFTFSFWLSLNAIQSEWHTLVANTGIGTTNDGFKLAISSWGGSNTAIRMETGNSSASASAITPVGYITYLNWRHVVFVVDRANATALIYVDGVLRNTGSTTILNDFKTTGQLYFGAATNLQGYANAVYDEVALYNRNLSVAEITALYRRGANRLKYQVRTCATASCTAENAATGTGQAWRGPDGSVGSYFSEMNNNVDANLYTGQVNSGSLKIDFQDFTGLASLLNPKRWFQYRVVFESDEPSSSTLCVYGSSSEPCSPEFAGMSIGPDHYPTSIETVTTKANLGTAFNTLNDGGFSATQSCAAGTRYTLSANGTDFYYWDGSDWVLSAGTYVTANGAGDIATRLPSFANHLANGKLQVKAFLKSDGETPCAISGIEIKGQR